MRSGISFGLAEATGERHCGLPINEPTTLASKLLEVPAELIASPLVLELQAGDVAADTLDGRACVFLAGLYRAEQVIAERLQSLARGMRPWPDIDADKAGAVPVVQLTEVFHEAAESQVIVNAHRINQGEIPVLEAKEGRTSSSWTQPIRRRAYASCWPWLASASRAGLDWFGARHPGALADEPRRP